MRLFLSRNQKGVREGIEQGCIAWKGKGIVRPGKLGCMFRLSPGWEVARCSDRHNWQLQIQRVAIAAHSRIPWGLQHCLCLFCRQHCRCSITQPSKYVLHKTGRSNTISLLFCEYIDPFEYQTHGCWVRQVFLSPTRLPKMQPIP